MSAFLRSVPDAPTSTLNQEEARAEAHRAFRRAVKAQGLHVSRLGLTDLLFTPPGAVNHIVLTIMIRQAEEQVRNAQAVVTALVESREALERFLGQETRR